MAVFCLDSFIDVLLLILPVPFVSEESIAIHEVASNIDLMGMM